MLDQAYLLSKHHEGCYFPSSSTAVFLSSCLNCFISHQMCRGPLALATKLSAYRFLFNNIKCCWNFGSDPEVKWEVHSCAALCKGDLKVHFCTPSSHQTKLQPLSVRVGATKGCHSTMTFSPFLLLRALSHTPGAAGGRGSGTAPLAGYEGLPLSSSCPCLLFRASAALSVTVISSSFHFYFLFYIP